MMSQRQVSDVARDSISKMTFLRKLCQVELGFSCLMSSASLLWRLKNLSPIRWRPQINLLTELTTGQRTHTKNAVTKCGGLD